MHRLLVIGAGALVALVLSSPAGAWAWPADGAVLRSFTLGSDAYAAGQHRGIDVGGAEGSPVRAPAAGTVTFVGSLPTYGRGVTIVTSDGYAVTLVHLGSTTAAKGDVVDEGEPVGTMGSSGDAEHPTPSVHLGVRVASQDEGYVDPLSLLPARAAVPQAHTVATSPVPAAASSPVSSPQPPAPAPAPAPATPVAPSSAQPAAASATASPPPSVAPAPATPSTAAPAPAPSPQLSAAVVEPASPPGQQGPAVSASGSPSRSSPLPKDAEPTGIRVGPGPSRAAPAATPAVGGPPAHGAGSPPARIVVAHAAGDDSVTTVAVRRGGTPGSVGRRPEPAAVATTPPPRASRPAGGTTTPASVPSHRVRAHQPVGSLDAPDGAVAAPRVERPSGTKAGGGHPVVRTSARSSQPIRGADHDHDLAAAGAGPATVEELGRDVDVRAIAAAIGLIALLAATAVRKATRRIDGDGAVLPHDADLLRQLDAAHRTRLHDGGGGRLCTPPAAARP